MPHLQQLSHGWYRRECLCQVHSCHKYSIAVVTKTITQPKVAPQRIVLSCKYNNPVGTGLNAFTQEQFLIPHLTPSAPLHEETSPCEPCPDMSVHDVPKGSDVFNLSIHMDEEDCLRRFKCRYQPIQLSGILISGYAISYFHRFLMLASIVCGTLPLRSLCRRKASR